MRPPRAAELGLDPRVDAGLLDDAIRVRRGHRGLAVRGEQGTCAPSGDEDPKLRGELLGDRNHALVSAPAVPDGEAPGLEVEIADVESGHLGRAHPVLREGADEAPVWGMSSWLFSVT
jgi:hypothetical protein